MFSSVRVCLFLFYFWIVCKSNELLAVFHSFRNLCGGEDLQSQECETVCVCVFVIGGYDTATLGASFILWII